MLLGLPDAVADPDRLAGQLRELAERAGARGMRVAYEALAWGRHVSTYQRSWEAVARADHPALGLCLDSFHILSVGGDPAEIATIPADKLFFLQLADAPHLRMDVLQWSRHHRLFPGQGAFDLPAFLEVVLAAGYRGPLSLEVFNGRVYFQIVRRIGGYDGYGWADAPVRMAAHRRQRAQNVGRRIHEC